MGIYERITSDGDEGDPTKIPVHPFYACLRGWLRSNTVTRTEIITCFSLTAVEQDEIDGIKSRYDTLGTALDKSGFLEDIHETWTLAEWKGGGSGSIRTKDAAKTELGF